MTQPRPPLTKAERDRSCADPEFAQRECTYAECFCEDGGCESEPCEDPDCRCDDCGEDCTCLCDSVGCLCGDDRAEENYNPPQAPPKIEENRVVIVPRRTEHSCFDPSTCRECNSTPVVTDTTPPPVSVPAWKQQRLTDVKVITSRNGSKWISLDGSDSYFPLGGNRAVGLRAEELRQSSGGDIETQVVYGGDAAVLYRSAKPRFTPDKIDLNARIDLQGQVWVQKRPRPTERKDAEASLWTCVDPSALFQAMPLSAVEKAFGVTKEIRVNPPNHTALMQEIGRLSALLTNMDKEEYERRTEFAERMRKLITAKENLLTATRNDKESKDGNPQA